MSKSPLRDVLDILRQQQEAIEKAIAELEQHSFIVTTNEWYRKTRPSSRRMSAAGRARIVAAQRARWAKWKKAVKKAA